MTNLKEFLALYRSVDSLSQKLGIKNPKPYTAWVREGLVTLHDYNGAFLVMLTQKGVKAAEAAGAYNPNTFDSRVGFAETLRRGASRAFSYQSRTSGDKRATSGGKRPVTKADQQLFINIHSMTFAAELATPPC